MSRSPAFAAVLLLLLHPAAPLRAGDEPETRAAVLHLTLPAAVRMALQRNFSLQVERFGPEIARQGVTAERGRFDPAFELSYERAETTENFLFESGLRTRSRSVDTIDRLSAGLRGSTPLGTVYEVGTDTLGQSRTGIGLRETAQSDTGLSITQPLLRGFGPAANLSRLRIARNQVLISEQALRQNIIEVVTRIDYAYYDLHFSQESLAVAERSRRRARQSFEDNSRRAQIGVMSPLDVTTARAEVAQRQEGVILGEASVRTSGNTLKQLVTNDVEPLLDTEVEIETPTVISFRPDVPAGIRDAFVHRPDYLQAMVEIRNLNITVAFAKNNLLPRLDLIGSLNLLGFDNDVGTALSRTGSNDRTAWRAGAVVSIPLGNRAARGALGSARLQAAQALVDLQRLEQEIVVLVDNASGQIVTNRQRIESTSVARKLAEESLSAGEERLRAGTGTTFEVLELQEKLSSAELAEVRAQADYNKAISEYRRVTGTTLLVNRVVVN